MTKSEKKRYPNQSKSFYQFLFQHGGDDFTKEEKISILKYMRPGFWKPIYENYDSLGESDKIELDNLLSKITMPPKFKKWSNTRFGEFGVMLKVLVANEIVIKNARSKESSPGHQYCVAHPVDLEFAKKLDEALSPVMEVLRYFDGGKDQEQVCFQLRLFSIVS